MFTILGRQSIIIRIVKKIPSWTYSGMYRKYRMRNYYKNYYSKIKVRDRPMFTDAHTLPAPFPTIHTHTHTHTHTHSPQHTHTRTHTHKHTNTHTHARRRTRVRGNNMRLFAALCRCLMSALISLHRRPVSNRVLL